MKKLVIVGIVIGILMMSFVSAGLWDTITGNAPRSAGIWGWSFCKPNYPCEAGQGDCDKNVDCKTNYCAFNVGLNYGQQRTMDVCECPVGTIWKSIGAAKGCVKTESSCIGNVCTLYEGSKALWNNQEVYIDWLDGDEVIFMINGERFPKSGKLKEKDLPKQISSDVMIDVINIDKLEVSGILGKVEIEFVKSFSNGSGFEFDPRGDYLKFETVAKKGDISVRFLYGSGNSIMGTGAYFDDRLAVSNLNSLNFLERNNGDDYHRYFIASSTQTKESYLLRAKVSQDYTAGRNETTIESYENGNWVTVCKEKAKWDNCDIGNVNLVIGDIYYVTGGDESAIITGGSGVVFNRVYNTKGNYLDLPIENEFPISNYSFSVKDSSGKVIETWYATYSNLQMSISSATTGGAITCPAGTVLKGNICVTSGSTIGGAVTYQGVLDMLNKCEILYETNPTYTCDKICKLNSKSCVFGQTMTGIVSWISSGGQDQKQVDAYSFNIGCGISPENNILINNIGVQFISDIDTSCLCCSA